MEIKQNIQADLYKEQIIRESYQIFCTCFPKFKLPYKVFCKLLDISSCKILTACEEEKIIGFAVVFQNFIRLLCVLPDYQRMGAGARLLSASEAEIVANGYDKCILGGVDSPLFMGAVTKRTDYENLANPYFQSHGYAAEQGCIEMKLALENVELSKVSVSIPKDVRFCYFSEQDRQPLYDAVAAVREDWVVYFLQTEHVFVAYQGNKIVSFAILDFDCDNVLSRAGEKIGSIGCVGTVPKSRKNGTGIALVALATEELKKHHCAESFIHWTYLESWYGKLGYETFLRYWFGEKKINK